MAPEADRLNSIRITERDNGYARTADRLAESFARATVIPVLGAGISSAPPSCLPAAWPLMTACITLVLGFGSSSRLAVAYGIAVTLTMVITTLLLCFVAQRLWNWKPWKVAIWVPSLLRKCASQGLKFEIERTTFFLSSETIVPGKAPGMARWRAKLFSVLARNAQRDTAFFSESGGGAWHAGRNVAAPPPKPRPFFTNF